ncbi:MAG: cupin domain-containing protein [Candidatus Thermoplasmatota archaeon]|nr:cupin domain-containing protein [Candidatus Thermoplasmatota archaeon]
MFHKKSNRLIHQHTVDNSHLAEIIHPIHNKKDPQTPYSLSHAQLTPGKQTTPHKLTHSTETYIIIKGHGEITVNDEKEHVSTGSILVVPPNTIQYIQNTKKTILEFYCIVSPPWQQHQDQPVLS